MYTVIGGHKQHCVVCQFILCLALGTKVLNFCVAVTDNYYTIIISTNGWEFLD